MDTCTSAAKMVYEFVEEKDGLETLMDERVGAATADVSGIAMSKLQVPDQCIVGVVVDRPLCPVPGDPDAGSHRSCARNTRKS